MFSYYGSKRELAGIYAEPRYHQIIEPFAGSAGYSLHGNRWQNDVLLLDRDQRLVDVWEWLIGEATRTAILALPQLRVGETSREFLSIASVAMQTSNTRTREVVTPSMAAAWEESRSYLASDISKVKHWSVRRGAYDDAPEVAATWFVDPPYQGDVGDGYVFGSQELDYERLSIWIRSRSGQTIACESGAAKYLPFAPLRSATDRPDELTSPEVVSLGGSAK